MPVFVAINHICYTLLYNTNSQGRLQVQKNIILFFLLITISIFQSSSAAPVKSVKPQMISIYKSFEMLEQAFIESCILTIARHTGKFWIDLVTIKGCEDLWFDYQTGRVGIIKPDQKK